MSIESDVAFLESVPLLSLVGGEALRVIAIGAETQTVPSGRALFRAGEAADCAYVVVNGSFEADALSGGEPQMIGPGALIGELAMIADTVRPMTVTALEQGSVMRIPRTLFLKMLEGYPDAARRVRDDVARRAEETATDIRKVRAALDGLR